MFLRVLRLNITSFVTIPVLPSSGQLHGQVICTVLTCCVPWTGFLGGGGAKEREREKRMALVRTKTYNLPRSTAMGFSFDIWRLRRWSLFSFAGSPREYFPCAWSRLRYRRRAVHSALCRFCSAYFCSGRTLIPVTLIYWAHWWRRGPTAVEKINDNV